MSLGIGIIAPSAPVGQYELELGIQWAQSKGWNVKVHSQVKKKSLYFAGDDIDRAQAILDYALDPAVQLLWCARGGSGSMRTLAALESLIIKRKIALSRLKKNRKTLMGYSDATLLLEYVSQKWGWQAIHGPMPGVSEFFELKPTEYDQISSLVQFNRLQKQTFKLKPLFAPAQDFKCAAPIVGGNLCVWTSAVGTPYQGQADGKIIFFEEVGESLYRVDRMVQQWIHSGGAKGVKAVVLGDFTDCSDKVYSVSGKRLTTAELESVNGNQKALHSLCQRFKESRVGLRSPVSLKRCLLAAFSDIYLNYKVPVFYGLPVGHGSAHTLVPLNALSTLEWKVKNRTATFSFALDNG